MLSSMDSQFCYNPAVGALYTREVDWLERNTIYAEIFEGREHGRIYSIYSE
jgi:hypothetical protein